MPRGKVGAFYTLDSGTQITTNVDADSVAEASRGWVALPANSSGFLAPKGLTMRRVYGIDATGARGSAIVATTDAPLWDGTVTTFNIEGTDGVGHLMVVTGRSGERLRMAHGPVGVTP